MTTVEENIKLTVEAYTNSFSASKPHISMTLAKDGDIVLFLADRDRVSLPHATGMAKTLDEAVSNLKQHLIKQIDKYKSESEQELFKINESRKSRFTKLDAALETLKKE